MKQGLFSIIAVDPGMKRIGLAICDKASIIARPLTVIKHSSLRIDAIQIAQYALENNAGLILIGASMDESGVETASLRHAQKLGDAIQDHIKIPIKIWDEWGTTQMAQMLNLEMDIPKRKRHGHQDALAATIILNSYLDALNDKA